MRLRWLVILCALGFGAPGCDTPPPASSPLTYTADAKRAFEAALALYEAHEWIGAEAQMREIMRKYRYSRYGAMAELRVADIAFEQDKFAEAIVSYRKFIETHRTLEDEAIYARSRIAEAEFRQVPDSFILSTAEERDQGGALDAYKEARSFLEDYPRSKESEKVRELYQSLTDRLIRHELYVAKFYLDRENYEAAVIRIKYALGNYGGGGTRVSGAKALLLPSGQLEAESLVLLGEVYLRMHKYEEARRAFETVLEQFSSTGHVIAARAHLTRMTKQRL
jgi:outer membrane protein assembly factor BamD